MLGRTKTGASVQALASAAASSVASTRSAPADESCGYTITRKLPALSAMSFMRALRGLVGWGIASVTAEGRAPLSLRSRGSSGADPRYLPGGFGRWALSRLNGLVCGI